LLIGFGGVGQELARILTSQGFKAMHPEFRLKVTGIATATKGFLYSESGVDLERALENINTNKHFSEMNPDWVKSSSELLIATADFDILVELSTLSIENRGHPAAGYIESALISDRNCVSANKGPLAFEYRKLTELAESRGLHFLYESTVMDGAPIFNLARYGFRGCRIEKVEGVLNATSNYVLARMEEGKSLQEAIREAQSAGFAEANPQYDIEGWDAAAKITVIANAFMGMDITPFEVHRDGIQDVTFHQLESALNNGKRLKLIASAENRDGCFKASVRLREVALDDPFARVPSDGSIIRIHTDLMGPLTIQQDAPTLSDTAYGVLNDLLEINAVW